MLVSYRKPIRALSYQLMNSWARQGLFSLIEVDPQTVCVYVYSYTVELMEPAVQEA